MKYYICARCIGADFNTGMKKRVKIQAVADEDDGT